MHFKIEINRPLKAEQVAALYKSAGLNRPIADLPRMQSLLDNANLSLSAWDGDTLIGLARCLCDYAWVCYLADLAVAFEHQRSGVGAALIEATRTHIGPKCQLLLLSAPTAMGYYPKVGFTALDNAFAIPRTKGV